MFNNIARVDIDFNCIFVQNSTYFFVNKLYFINFAHRKIGISVSCFRFFKNTIAIDFFLLYTI